MAMRAMTQVSGKTAIEKNARNPAGQPEFLEACSVHVGEALLGVPIAHILEIVGNARPQRVPLAPSYIGGLVHYRGDVLTTVSLRHLMGLPPNSGAQDIMVIENQEHGSFGLLVDAVGEVMTVSSADYEDNPSTMDERRRRFFGGAYKQDKGLLVMLNTDGLDPVRLGIEEGLADAEV